MLKSFCCEIKSLFFEDEKQKSTFNPLNNSKCKAHFWKKTKQKNKTKKKKKQQQTTTYNALQKRHSWRKHTLVSNIYNKNMQNFLNKRN